MPTRKMRSGPTGDNRETKATANPGNHGRTGSPAKFDGRKNTAAGTDNSVRGRANDPSPSIVHWTRTV